MSEPDGRDRLPGSRIDAGIAPGILWTIFGAALALRLAYVLTLYLALGPEALTAEDSQAFLLMARGMAEGGLELPIDVMPLYILFLAGHFAVAGSWDPLFPVLSQTAIDSLTCVITALIAGTFDRRLTLPAGLFAALNPSLIILSGLLYTDTLFVCFATLSLLAALRWLESPRWDQALILGGALGLALSTRVMIAPWGVALILALPLSAALCRRFRPRAVLQVITAVAICVALQAPVLARSLSEYGSFQLTTQGGTHALLWIVPLVREAKDGTPHAVGAREMDQRFLDLAGPAEDNPFRKSARMTSLAVDALGELGPAPIIKAWAIGAAINLFAPAAILSPVVSRLPRTGFYATEGESKLAKIENFLFRNDNPAYAWVLLVSLAGVALFRAFQAYGMVSAFGRSREARIALALLLGWVVFILLINGPIASAKYRLPIEPVMALFSAQAFVMLRDRLARRKRPREPEPSRPDR